MHNELQQLPSEHSNSTHSIYTEAPELSSHLIVGSLHMLFWLLFHPSAWRHYIQRIDPALRPDFALADLSRTQWHNLQLWRLLVMGYIILPLLLAPLLLVLLVLTGSAPAFLAGGIILCLSCALGIGIVSALAVSVAGGINLIATVSLITAIVIGVLQGAELMGTTGSLLVLLAVGTTSSIGSATSADIAGGRFETSRVAQLTAAFVAFLIALGLGISAFSAAAVTGGGIYFSSQGGAVIGAMPGIAVGLAVWWRSRNWRRGLLVGLVGALLNGIAGGVTGTIGSTNAVITTSLLSSLMIGIAMSYSLGAHYALPYVAADILAGPWVAASVSALGTIATAIAFASIFGNYDLIPILPLGVVSILGLTSRWWRYLPFYPLVSIYNLLLFQADRQGRNSPAYLRWHSAFWDEHQKQHLTGLDQHILVVAEYNPAEAQAAIDYLSSTGSQRWAAQAAQIELDIRRLERCTDMEAIRQVRHTLVADDLEGPTSRLMRQVARVSRDVDASLNQESSYNQRMALADIEKDIDQVMMELTRSSEPYARRFQPVMEQWRRVIKKYHLYLIRQFEERQEISSPYIIGIPLANNQIVFVGRTDIGARIEELLQTRQNISLLLYGQRRMGKTSLLNNLGRLLRDESVPLFVDLQGPISQASSHAGLLYGLSRAMIKSAKKHRDLDLPTLERDKLDRDPFLEFDEWLDQVERAIRRWSPRGTALLALDEFEALDHALRAGQFEEKAVLGTLRNITQHRFKGFKVLISGSHSLEELQNWSSYMIGMQPLKIGYLEREYALGLIEKPVPDFELRYEPEASQRVLDLTRGHPFLVQLLCSEIVALKNEHPVDSRRIACLQDVEKALIYAIESGSMFFGDIEYNQVNQVGRDMLRFLAHQGEGAVLDYETLIMQCDNDEPAAVDAFALLQRRDVIEPAEGGYRFQVEMIRRWFAR